MEYIPIRASDIIRQVNRDIYLPAIQREFVWDTERIERLFDSIMADFPIGSFLYWRLEQNNKNEWPVYEFIRDYNGEAPHNPSANMAGITQDINLVLDGQQRITSLFIGLRGSYRYLYYRWRKTKLYLNLLKSPLPSEDNPEELTYEFAFREDAKLDGDEPQLWYLVGRILDFEDAEDAKLDMKPQLSRLPGGLNRSTQHFILNGKDGVYGDVSRISSRFHCGRESGVVGSLAKRGVAESDRASVW